MRSIVAASFLFAAGLCLSGPALADNSWFDDGTSMFDAGKLLATGGVSQVEGAGGGGLANWASIGGYGYRTKPDNLGIARKDNAWDGFVAYFSNKNPPATLAYVDLGNIVIHDNQQGLYLSVQAGL